MQTLIISQGRGPRTALGLRVWRTAQAMLGSAPGHAPLSPSRYLSPGGRLQSLLNAAQCLPVLARVEEGSIPTPQAMLSDTYATSRWSRGNDDLNVAYAPGQVTLWTNVGDAVRVRNAASQVDPALFEVVVRRVQYWASPGSRYGARTIFYSQATVRQSIAGTGAQVCLGGVALHHLGPQDTVSKMFSCVLRPAAGWSTDGMSPDWWLSAGDYAHALTRQGIAGQHCFDVHVQRGAAVSMAVPTGVLGLGLKHLFRWFTMIDCSSRRTAVSTYEAKCFAKRGQRAVNFLLRSPDGLSSFRWSAGDATRFDAPPPRGVDHMFSMQFRPPGGSQAPSVAHRNVQDAWAMMGKNTI